MYSTQSSSSHYDLGGTLRERQAAETLDWVRPMLPLFGITRVAHITGLDNIGIAVTTCMRPNAKHLSVSQGKGHTKELAEISAIMESIESFHAENSPPISFMATYHEMKKQFNYPSVDPSYFNQGAFNKKGIKNYLFGWTEGFEIATKNKIYVPHILTCIDSSIDRPEYAFMSVSSNGLAAGNTKEEALCHGLYEVIERDALYQWQQLSYKNRKLTTVDISTIFHDINASYISKIKKANIDIKLWNITSPIGIPTFHCAITDKNIFRELNVFTGTGTHLSKDIALSRAITEAVQGRLTCITGCRDDVFIDFYQEGDEITTHKNDIENGGLDYNAIPEIDYDKSFSSTINLIICLLQNQGYKQIIYVDHTKSEFNVPVIQIFVPGLMFNGARM